MSTKALSSTSSSPSTFSAPTVHSKKSDALSNKVRTVFATTSSTHSTTLPLLPPPSSSSTHTSTASALLSQSTAPVTLPKKIETTFSFEQPLLNLFPDSPPLPPPPKEERRSHRKTSDPSIHTKIHRLFSSSTGSIQTTPLETLTRDVNTLSVPISARDRSHSASPRSHRKEGDPNRLLYTEFVPSTSVLSSDLLKPIRMSRQRSNSLPPPLESGSSGSSRTARVGTHYSYSKKSSHPNWCYTQMLYAATLVQQNASAKAIEVYRQVIAEDQKNIAPWSEPYIRLATLEAQAKNPEGARETLSLVIKGKNFDPWAKINALVTEMIVLEPSQEYSDIQQAYASWRQAKELIRGQPESVTVQAYLGHYGKKAKGIRLRKEAIEGATTTV